MNHALLFNVHNLGFRRPPGPYRIATILRNEGWDCEVIEFAHNWTLEQLQELARSRITSNTVFVGFGVILFDEWGSECDIEKFSKWLKKEYPAVKQILGGQWPPVQNSNFIDYYITGYAEYALLELVKVLLGSSPISSLKFDPMYFGTKKKVLSGNKFYPSFPMKSLKIIYENRDFLKPIEWLTIEFGRGCKFSCPYCTYPILNVKGDYTRDADDARIQLEHAYDNYGIQNYFVADETFNDRTEKITKFADVVENLNFDTWFSGFIRADLLVSRKEDWEHLRRMNFLGHFYGIETMNHATAKSIKKGMDPNKLLPGILEAKRYFQTHGRKLYRGTIAQVIGLPHETKESVQRAFEWLETNWEGEGVTIRPLEIPTDPKVDVLSELSLNWKEYGYEEIPPRPEVQVTHYCLRNGNMNSNLIWKNQHMDYYYALEVIDKWRLKVESKKLFGATNFTLDYTTYQNKTIEQALQYRQHTLTEKRIQLVVKSAMVSITDYIEKKLSL